MKPPTLELPSLVDLMEAGAHFGHKKHRSHPGVRKHIFTVRDRVLVINLESTRAQLAEASEYLAERAQAGAMMLFVGTKRQAAEPIKAIAEALEQPYVHQRWLGGTLTNFETIQKRLARLRELETMVVSEAFTTEHTKKQRAVLERELARLERTLGGLKRLTRIPDVVVIVDTDEEKNTLAEAQRLRIPVVAIVDTNANPDAVLKPIVANDDSAKAVQLILDTLHRAIERGRSAKPIASTEAASTKQGVGEEQLAEEPVAEEKPAKKPAAKKATAKKPAAGKPAVKKPTTKKKPTKK